MYRFLALPLVMIFSACSAPRAGAPVKISEIRKTSPITETVQVTLQRDDLMRALSRQKDSGAIRMVPIYNSVAPGEIPEYRLFNVSTQSVYRLLGLENADVLVAAHGYVVQQPQQFSQYISVLPTLDQGEIEVRREGKPIVFRYEMLPAQGGNVAESDRALERATFRSPEDADRESASKG